MSFDSIVVEGQNDAKKGTIYNKLLFKMMICLVKWNKDQRNKMYFFLEHNLVRRLFTTILSDLF